MTKKVQDLEAIQKLLELGALTVDEFEEQKKRILGHSPEVSGPIEETGDFAPTKFKQRVLGFAVVICLLAAFGWLYLAQSQRNADLSSHFGTQGHFCDYLTNKDILIPKSATHLIVKDRSKGDSEDLEVWKFDGILHGLTVLGIGNVYYEGGTGVAVIFDNAEDEMLSTLRSVFGSGPYGIPSRGANVTYREGQLPLFLQSLGAEVTVSEYGFGKSALMCGAID